ncbi:putative membrane protein [Paraburkholderia sp. BL8N3]|nr:putative membrane protein [Paraburkholderia sp. BL8N3]
MPSDTDLSRRIDTVRRANAQAIASQRRAPSVPGVLLQGALKLAYPVVILCAWRLGEPRYIGVALFALLWLQRWLGAGGIASALRRLSTLDWCIAGGLSAASAAIALTNSETLLRCYPALVNAGLLAAFGATLAHPPSMIEKFARVHEPDLPPRAIAYTRRVTQVWCAFFVLNGAFSAYTAHAFSRDAWALYNGVIAYALIGVLFAGEIAWRHAFVKPRRGGVGHA